jgi:hypothetical protein
MSFSNIIPGPVVSISSLDMKKNTIKDLLDRGLIVISYITDNKHPAFKLFKESRPEENPVAVFITIEYLYDYE